MPGVTDGIGLAAIGAGSLFLYSGIKGTGVSASIQGLIRGTPPSAQPVVNPLIQPPAGTSGPAGADAVAGSGASAGLAADFLTYVGKVPYVWGGASPVRGWDCSGSCNYVICHDMGLDIPGSKGGTFDGSSHGPSTFGWLAWAPGNMQHLAAADVTADDLVIWQTHMGVATSNTRYVSAFDTQDGTVENPIHGGGPFGEIATFWRLGGASQPRGAQPGKTGGG